MKVALIPLVLIACLSNVGAFKILFFIPVFGISHVRFSGKLADVLADAGHEVIVYQPVLDESVKTKGFSSPNITKYYRLPRNPGDYPSFVQEDAIAGLWEGMPLSAMTKFGKSRAEFCEGIMKDKKNLDALEAEKFDLVVTEWFEPCGYGVINAIGAKKYVTTWSGGLNSAITGALGVKPHWSYSVGHNSVSTEVLSFGERIKELIGHFLGELIFLPIMMGGISDAIRQHHPEFDLSTAVAKSAFVFVNSEDHVDYVIPRTPKVILIPNMDNEKPKPLTGRVAEVVESSNTRGIVLFSFGSTLQACTMPSHVKTAFMEAFKEFPDITFFWKYEKPEDGTAADIQNVFLDNLPVFADQPRNTALLTYRGMGFGLDHKTLTKEKVVEALNEILNNKKYKEKAQLIHRMIQARPLSTKESFIKHIEFAAEFGDTGTLSAEGANQSVFVFHSLDVIGFLLAVVIVVVLLLKWVIVSVVRLVRIKLVKCKKE
uniref:glucuronosyltransferase n=1 Tax=Panagrellus redivivus TaxID=6233 RepID=A0A7E4USM0_PANRE